MTVAGAVVARLTCYDISHPRLANYFGDSSIVMDIDGIALLMDQLIGTSRMEDLSPRHIYCRTEGILEEGHCKPMLRYLL